MEKASHTVLSDKGRNASQGEQWDHESCANDELTDEQKHDECDGNLNDHIHTFTHGKEDKYRPCRTKW